MARGYMERVLWVDLSRGTLWEEKPDERLYRDYLGGYGVGARVLYDRMKPGVDPLGPDNILGFITGPLTGTPALIGSRYTVVGKSPLTKTWGDANSGGHFGPAMKFAGYDAVFVVGAAKSPVCLILRNGEAELRDATRYWGMTATDFEDAIKQDVGAKAEVSAIGPAGEAMSLISCPISSKGRTPGRSGLGAVMGAKKLKAVVALGDMEVPVADPARLAELRRSYLQTLTSGFAEMYKSAGTPALVAGCVEGGDAPVRNWASAAAAEGWDAAPLFGERVIALQKKKWGCWHCPLACGGEMDSRGAGRHLSHKPEYETICAFGTACLNNDLDSIIRCNDICNAYGLDTISAGATVAFAIECFENGLLTKEDTDGLDLRWGNSEAIVAVTEKMARREGFGAWLADGVKMAAERIGKGAERFAMHVQGQELPMHDPKFYPGMGTIYHIDDAPGRHMHGLGWGITMAPEWLLKQGIQPGDQYQYGANGESYKRLTTISNVINASGLCMFGWLSQDPDYTPRFLSAVTGWELSFEDLHVIGERIANIRHAFNLREGLNPRKWNMPGRAIGVPPTGKGPLGQITVDLEANEVAYLKAFDWDPETTVPSARKLAELGLGDVAKDLGISS
ncbi:MAG: aldehyde ferredoxin oxidoreductase family protein [Chloroflexota bacterium]